MPKKPILLPCMFCGKQPCECNKPAPKVKREPKPKATPTPAPAADAPAEPPAPVPIRPSRRQRPSAVAAMKAAAATKAAPPPTPEVAATEDEDDPIDPAFGTNEDGLPGALRNMWSMLHPDEKTKHAETVGVDWARNERRLDWLRKAGRV